MILFTKRSLLALAACVISLSSSRLFAQDSRHGYYAPPAIETLRPVAAKHGMVAAQEKIAAQIGRDVLSRRGHPLDAAAARERVVAVALATGANRASMLQDVEAGRRTEIDAITGVFLDMARRHGADAPTHRAVFTLVKRLEG